MFLLLQKNDLINCLPAVYVLDVAGPEVQGRLQCPNAVFYNPLSPQSAQHLH